MTLVALALVAYLIGSIPFAVIVSRVFALPDPRSYGSGNPGATNVLRTGRKAAAALTLIGDAAKGWLAVFVPFFAFLLYGMNRFALEPAVALTIIALLIVWRHRANIRNLLAGTEGT